MPDRASDTRADPRKARAAFAPRRTSLLALILGLLFVFGTAPNGYAETTPKPAAKPSSPSAKSHATTHKKATGNHKKTAGKKSSHKGSKKKHKAAAKPKPPAPLPITSSVLTTNDIAALKDALNEADRNNWQGAMQHRERISNKATAKFVLWYRLVSKDSGATLAEIEAFQEQNPSWPRMALLKVRAEEAVLAYPMSDKDLLRWFATNPPQTGEGKIRYGKTLIASGNVKDGKLWIQRAWAEDDFSSQRQREIVSVYGTYLTSAVHKERLDRLLWDRSTADARYTAALINSSSQALADARIKLMTQSSSAQDAVSRVPGSLQSDPGLLFDRIRYERKTGNDNGTVPLILTAPDQPHQMVDPEAWWTERKIAARVALSNGQYQDAYDIVSKHGLTDGSDFADAEFFCGWIALQYLNKPDIALSHFKRLKNSVSTPISLARADYWSGRAASAKGDKQNAEVFYRLAANNPTTFYGQLSGNALAHLKGTDARLRLPADPKPTAADKTAFSHLELVTVARVLHDFHRDQQEWTFMLHMADTLEKPQELVQLADLAIRFDDPKLSLRIAKTASQRNILLPARAYPVNYMPAYQIKGLPVEKALVYGLSRQESEFDPSARSPVGARGLMQLMPRTAKVTAQKIDVPYSTDRLTSDPSYNAMLGSAHLGELIDGFSGSYIMSVAAYNAGASRVGEWQETYGDPRSSAVDPVDWIENIPFSETRNYVQRVMENLEVYRTRLSGSAQKIRLADDIRRNTGTPITTAAPVPGRIPLATPLGAASSMSPVVEDDESPSLTDTNEKDDPAPLAPLKRKNAKP